MLIGTLFAAAVAFPSWMTGSWSSDSAGTKMEEHWTTADGGLMLGMHRDVSAKGIEFEFLRIEETDGKLVYQAQPFGKPATPFALKTMTADRVVFENPTHDFPQRIIYWRKGDQLCARVEGRIQGKAEGEEWCWSRAIAISR